jgi:hypothetical protein
MAFVTSEQTGMYWGIIGSGLYGNTVTHQFNGPHDVWSYPVLQHLSLGGDSYVNTFISGFTDAAGPHSGLAWIGAYLGGCTSVTFWMEMEDAVAGASAITMFFD